MTINRRILYLEEYEISVKEPFKVEISKVENLGTKKVYTNITVDEKQNKILLKENNPTTDKYFQQWKQKHVTVRGMRNAGEPNEVSGFLGRGLYTAPLSNKNMAKQYGEVYFVINAIPDKAKVVESLNQAEIFIQNIVNEFCKENNMPFDRRFFDENTTIESEMLDRGFNGLIVKGREMVHYDPPESIKYFKTETELKNYFTQTRFK